MTKVSAKAISNALLMAKHITDGPYKGTGRSDISYNDTQRTQYDMLTSGLRHVRYQGYLGLPTLDVRKDVLVGGIVKPLGAFLRSESQKDDQHYGILIVVKNENAAQHLKDEWIRKKMFSDADVAVYDALSQTQYTKRKAQELENSIVNEDEKPLEFSLPQDVGAPQALAPQFNKRQLILTQQAFVSLTDRGLISPQHHPVVVLYDGDKIKGTETEAALREFAQDGHVLSFGGPEQKMLFDVPAQRAPSVSMAGRMQTRKPKRVNSAHAPFLSAFGALFEREPLSKLDAEEIVEKIKDRVSPDVQNVSAAQVGQWRTGTHMPLCEDHIRVIAKLAGQGEDEAEQLVGLWVKAKEAPAVVQESRVRQAASGKDKTSTPLDAKNAPSSSSSSPDTAAADTVRTPAERHFLKTIAQILEEVPPFAGCDDAGVVALLHEADSTLNVTEAQISQWREEQGELPEDERFGAVVDAVIRDHAQAQNDEVSDDLSSPSDTPADTVRTPAELHFLREISRILREVPPFAGCDDAGVVALLQGQDPELNVTEAQISQWREERGELPEDERFGAVVDAVKENYRSAQQAAVAQGKGKEKAPTSPPVSENLLPATIAGNNGVNGHRCTNFERKFSIMLGQGKFRRTNDAQAAQRINETLPANVERVTGELVHAWRERSGELPTQEVVTAFFVAGQLRSEDKKILKVLWNNDQRLPCDAERFAPESRGHRADAVRERRFQGYEAQR